MLTAEKMMKTTLVIGIVGVMVCIVASYGDTGEGASNIFCLNNKNATLIDAVNNWDGTVTVTWTNIGTVVVVRQEQDNPSNEKILHFNGNSFRDTFELSELNKNYIYFLRALDGTVLAGSCQPVKPEIIVVLVRGYSAFGDGLNPNYWRSNTTEQAKGLVGYVKTWFEQKGITCWDASEYLNGTLSVSTNAVFLRAFIEMQRIGEYENAKIHLFGHSMGGLISRKYANDNPGVVKNIYCAQTPHTGSPLAELRGLWPDNPATYSLLPLICDIFNSTTNIGNTGLYSTYSSNSLNVLSDPSLMLGYSMIMVSGGVRFIPSTSDGAVPTESAKGRSFLLDRVFIKSLYNSGLDHFSCYRHPTVLNRVLGWLDPFNYLSMMSDIVMPMDGDDPYPLTPLYYVSGFTGQFDDTNPISRTVSIGSTSKAYFRALVTDPNECTLTLTTPDYVTIDAETSDPNIVFYAENGIKSFEVQHPTSGQWSMNLTTVLSSPDSVDFGLSVFEGQQIIIIASSDPEWVNTGQSILLRAEVSDDTGTITGAMVTMKITMPDKTVQSINLFDDGTNGDSLAADGIYHYLFSDTTQAGQYDIEAKATGVANGGTFERTAFMNFTAAPADIAISGILTDEGIDTDDNGDSNLLRIKVPVVVQMPKEYRLTANLLDSASEQIALVNTGLLMLNTDANNITIDVPADEIVKHNIDGPYGLVNIRISDGSTGLTIASAEDYTTAGYVISDFEQLDSDKDGLPDWVEINIYETDPLDQDCDEDGVSDGDEVLIYGTDFLDSDSDDDGMPDGYEIAYGLNPLLDDRNRDLDSDGLTNWQEYLLGIRPSKIDTDDDGRNDRWELDNGTNPLVYEEFIQVSADLNTDATVDVLDLAIMASQWLSEPGNPSADISPTPIDGFVNLLDFALLAENWLTTVE